VFIAVLRAKLPSGQPQDEKINSNSNSVFIGELTASR